MVSYHRESLYDIRSHSPSWITLGNDKREFTSSVSCHMSYVQPILNAVEMLWSPTETEEGILYIVDECRQAVEQIRANGFGVIPEMRQSAEICRASGEPYMRYYYRIRRDTEYVRDICKEFIERSKLLLTGKREVPEELYDVTASFASEVMTLRACSGNSERFHAAMRMVLPLHE